MPIGLGTLALTDPAVLAAAVDAGVDLVDTADAYGNEALVATIASRVTVVTKGGLVQPGWVPDGRARHLAAAARSSLAKLGRIDLYLLHAIDPKVPFATSVRALARLQADGAVGAIGLANVNTTQLEAALALAPISAVEVELSPWRLDALRGGLIARCRQRGLQVIAHRPLGGPAGVKRIARDRVLAELATRRGGSASPAQLVLAWLRTLGTVPIPGATRIETALACAVLPTLDADEISVMTAHFTGVDSRMNTHPTSPAADSLDYRMNVHSSISSAAAESDSRMNVHSAISSAAAEFDSRMNVHSAISLSVDSFDSRMNVHSASTPRGDDAHDPGTSRPPSITPGAHVILVMGMPGSGKTTFAKTLGGLRLNRDERGGTLAAIARALDEALAAGERRIVLDNTYGTRALARTAVIAAARRHGASVTCIAMTTTLEQAQANAARRMLERNDRLLEPGELLRAPEIPPSAQFRYRRGYEPPAADEGFDRIELRAFVADPPAAGLPGVIVELDGFVWSRTQLAPRPEALARIAAWQAAGLTVCGTTWMTPPVAHARLELPIACCPHAAGPPVCWCRKPLPGLGLLLARRLGLDLARTIVVGTGAADRGFAQRLGCRFEAVS